MAQQGLQVTLNRSFFKPGDTIRLQAVQINDISKTATLFLMAEHENGMSWEMRWPMLKGKCEAALVIPDSLPEGQYRLRFSVLQNLFTVFGKVLTPAGIRELNTTLLTSGGELYETEVSVTEAGTFAYKNVLFSNDATLVFTMAGRQNEALDIEIATVLDSAIYPRKNQVINIYIGNTEPATPPAKFTSENDSAFTKAQVLEAVTVYSKPPNLGEIFDKNYTSPLFRGVNERIISVLDDPFLNNAMTALQVVRMRTPGITITGGLYPLVSWRGAAVSFFIDEMRVSSSDINMIPMADVAIIKVFPPPFFGNIGGSGGAVAVYTRRGALTGDNFTNAFKVKGYTPLFSIFPVIANK